MLRTTLATCPPPTVPDDQVALYAVDSAGAERTVTRHELAEQVDRAAAVMHRLGVRAGDQVALHLPVIPEAAAALLACTRIGAVPTTLGAWPTPRPHQADELARRRRRHVRLVVTADGGSHQGKPQDWLATVDRAFDLAGAAAPTAPPVLVVRYHGRPTRRRADHDRWWHRMLAGAAIGTDLTGPTAGEPAAGLRLGLRSTDVYWCAADLEWLVRHPTAVSGPLAVGAAQVLCEDGDWWARTGRLWEIVHGYGVSVLHADPNALRDVLGRSGTDGRQGQDALALRRVAGIGGADGAELWYWQRERRSATAATPWELRIGSSPWAGPAGR
ncbi:AMP-binding protein [Kitasatospora sp. NPDC018058]|uniref:AMP-binding protein n=1 Tax=Kitasatospora sp. NPDC018058 TaxID=3364025 RepID=UPI0037C1937E